MEYNTKSTTNMMLALAILIPICQSCFAHAKVEDKSHENGGFVPVLPVGYCGSAYGKPGIDGKPGRDGRDGRDGLQGHSGKPGLQGPPGLQGAKGEQGFKGQTGPPGHTFKPQAVAFTAKTENEAYKVASNQERQIHFNVIVTNIGGDFHQDQSAFICRVPGLYFFTFNFISNGSSNSHCYVDIMHEKKVIVRGVGQGTYQTCSGQAVLLLKKKERVWLKLLKTRAIQAYRLENSFSGFLIQEM